MTQIHSHLMLGRVCLTTNAGPYKPKQVPPEFTASSNQGEFQ